MEEQRTNANENAGVRKGGRNLAILGIVSIVIAICTTGVSLLIYHNSGDIYLDRSRPGFLPDEDESKTEEPEEEYVFQKTGEMTMAGLEEYLDELEKVVKIIDSYDEPFAADALSDEKLGI